VIFVIPTPVRDAYSLIVGNGSAFSPTTATPLNPWATYGNAAGVSATFNAGWSGLASNSPYACNNAYEGTGSFKLVSAGLRLQYTGTVMNQSGLIVCYHSPEHANLSGLNYNELQAFDEVDIRAVDREPCLLSCFPVKTAELQFPFVGTYGSGRRRVCNASHRSYCILGAPVYTDGLRR